LGSLSLKDAARTSGLHFAAFAIGRLPMCRRGRAGKFNDDFTANSVSGRASSLGVKKAVLLIIGVLLIVFGVFTALTTTVVTFLVPPTYASAARISLAVTGPSAVGAEVSKIQSKTILDRVATDLDLGKEWARKFKRPNVLSPEETYTILKGSIVIQQARDRGLIEIRVFSDNMDEAATIANKIAAVYRDSVLVTKSFDGTSAVQIIERAEPCCRYSFRRRWYRAARLLAQERQTAGHLVRAPRVFSK
jgi:capsular polysaccharide biosynthesis protein